MDNFEFIFDSSTNILYKNYFGKINMDDIYNSWHYAFENNLIPPNTKGFILDYRKASFDIDSKKYKKIVSFYKKNISFFKDKKIAVITNSSKDIVIPILVEQKDKGYSSKPFSTVEAAIRWIHI